MGDLPIDIVFRLSNLLHNLHLLQKSHVLVKQEDDYVTDSKNTFAKQKEMTRMHPNQSLDT